MPPPDVPLLRNHATHQEGETLALSLQHLKMFTLGCKNLLVTVDHKPLLGISKDCDLISFPNQRLLHFKGLTSRGHFNVQCFLVNSKGAQTIS